MNSSPFELSAQEAGAALRAGRLTSEALTEACLERISAYDGGLNAFVKVFAAPARAAARVADAELRAGIDRGPLHGLPYAVKDLLDVAGEPTTCNSHTRAGHVATSDSTVVRRLRDGGAILIGKLNLHEFGTGGSGEGMPHPPARNPWATDRVTGGSSSGSGVAVAARFLRLTIGTDSGGSLRLPGAYCGAVGLKPTYGRVSRRGAFPLSHSLDHVGPLARSVEEAALLLQAIAGFDAGDPASADQPTDDYLADLKQGALGLRVGIPVGHFGLADSFDPAVEAALDAATRALSIGGAVVVPVELPDLEAFRATGMAIMLAEAFAVHRDGLATQLASYAPETAERFLLGAGITDVDLVHALRSQHLLSDRVDAAMADCDVLLTASAIGGAGLLAEREGMMATPRLIPSLPFSVTGHPAIHVPTSVDARGLPVGLQIVGRKFGEATLLRAAFFIEACSGWRDVALPELG